MRSSDGYDDADWRAVVVLALALAAAAAAHGAAGGALPGLGGLAAVLVALLPVGLAVRAWGRGRTSMLLLSLLAQVVGHLGLALATSGGGAGSSAHGHTHAGHAVPEPTTDAPLVHHLTTHLSPSMLGAHLAAAVVTAVLVHAVTAFSRRLARRFVALLRQVVVVGHPHRPSCARTRVATATLAPALLSRPRRGPPLVV